VVAPFGTVTTTLLSDQLVVVAACPLKVTVPAVDPKLLPAMVTETPGPPLFGLRLLIVGANTVNAEPLLAPPDVVTMTFPLVAPLGTLAVILVFVQTEVVAACPLNVTVPVVVVKLFPAMVTELPGSALEGVKPLMVGAGGTVKATPGLATPPDATATTFPVVAPIGTVAVMLLVVQVVMGAVTPLNVTMLPADWVLKFAPEIVIEEPIAPVLGVRLVMLGADVTVNVGPAGLETPPAAVTTTDPVVAPAGTMAVMLLVVQLVIDVAGVPLNFTALPVPWVLKFVPVIVTDESTAPVFGVKLVMLGADVTVNVGPVVLTWPPTVTDTSPVVAPAGTVAVMLLVLQFVIVDACVLTNFTVLPTCDDRKLVPAITMEEPIAPVVGVKLVTVGNPVPRGNVICESKLPPAAPSISSSPL
jgi:hypothetical protein